MLQLETTLELPAAKSVRQPVRAMDVAVIIATRGRPAIVNELVKELAQQSKAPAHTFVIATRAEDVSQLNVDRPHLTVQIGRTGLTMQRNDGLALAGSQFSYIVFFDDDFIPSRFWLERMIGIFESNPD